MKPTIEATIPVTVTLRPGMADIQASVDFGFGRPVQVRRTYANIALDAVDDHRNDDGVIDDSSAAYLEQMSRKLSELSDAIRDKVYSRCFHEEGGYPDDGS